MISPVLIFWCVRSLVLPPYLMHDALNIVHDWMHDATSHNLFPF